MSDGPRIPPVDPTETAKDIQGILAFEPEGLGSPLSANNIFPTLAQHPDLFKAWLPFGGRLLTGSILSDRDREILILRTAVNSNSSYEWGQHVRIGLHVGMTDEEVHRVLDGPEADGWTQHEAALIRAADELEESSLISDATWATLEETYSREQLMEATMLVGHYKMVAFALNSFGVELDEGLEPLPPSQ